MKDHRRLTLLGALVGGLLLASCNAAGPLPSVAILLLGSLAVVGLGGLAAGCRGDRGAIGRNTEGTGGAGGGTSNTGGAGGAGGDSFPGCGRGTRPLGADISPGWFRCCVGTEVRLCPPVPPNTACNYGVGQTFCPDNVTCGFTWDNPCGAPDGGTATDAAADASADGTIATDAGTLADATTDATTGDTSSDAFAGCGQGSLPINAAAPTGWFRCCLGIQVRLCPPTPPTVACNYGVGQTFCADGVTCGFTSQDPCGTADAGVAETGP